MSFACPHLDEQRRHCGRLNQLCVPGRPGCLQEGKATFAEDLETRLRKAEQRAKNRPRRRPAR